ncbi:uncharacterized protein PSFLO_03739 [Pseudozyma flocculosa]|uniref:Uncharacterized protein n=1 Tax=Pseudozyma flocculosa TaxID=84751 RepID=A0A5C3F1U3_9BASI|nr:uncharacterized protein PSFLO_03739 [Pseudozyma flocculosa]
MYVQHTYCAESKRPPLEFSRRIRPDQEARLRPGCLPAREKTERAAAGVEAGGRETRHVVVYPPPAFPSPASEDFARKRSRPARAKRKTSEAQRPPTGHLIALPLHGLFGCVTTRRPGQGDASETAPYPYHGFVIDSRSNLLPRTATTDQVGRCLATGANHGLVGMQLMQRTDRQRCSANRTGLANPQPPYRAVLSSLSSLSSSSSSSSSSSLSAISRLGPQSIPQVGPGAAP